MTQIVISKFSVETFVELDPRSFEGDPRLSSLAPTRADLFPLSSRHSSARARSFARSRPNMRLSPLSRKPDAHADEVWSLCFERTGDSLLTGSLDESVKRWDVSDSSSSGSEGVLSSAHAYTGHSLGVVSIDASSDGLVAASALDGVIRAWDGETGETVLALESGPAESWGVAFDPNEGSSLLAVAGGVAQCVNVYNVRDGSKKSTLELPATTTEKPQNGRFVHCVAYSPDGKRIACGASDGTVAVFDVKTGKCAHTLSGHVSPVRDLTFSPDGKTLYTACDDGYAHAYDAHNKSLIESLGGHKSWVLSVAVHPSGDALVTASSDSTVKLWDLAARACAQTMTDHSDAVWRVRFSPDGSKLACASADRSVSIFNRA